MYGDVWDHWVIPGLTTTSTFSIGGFVQFWSHAAATLPVDPNPQIRIVPTSYPGVTAGELLLSLDFTPGCDSTFDTTATLCGAFSNSTFGGGSTALFNVTDGTWASRFDVNNPALGGADMSGVFAFRCADPGTDPDHDGCDPTNPLNTVLFSLNLDGSIEGKAIPEPMRLLMMVPGLLALGATTRRRRLRR